MERFNSESKQKIRLYYPEKLKNSMATFSLSGISRSRCVFFLPRRTPKRRDSIASERALICRVKAPLMNSFVRPELYPPGREPRGRSPSRYRQSRNRKTNQRSGSKTPRQRVERSLPSSGAVVSASVSTEC